MVPAAPKMREESERSHLVLLVILTLTYQSVAAWAAARVRTF